MSYIAVSIGFQRTMGYKPLKCLSRSKLRATLVGMITVAIILLVLADRFEAYDPLSYIQGAITCFQGNSCEHAKQIGVAAEDKILVIPAMESIDMSWVAEELPE
jgi:hypothetical protein